MGKCVLRRDGNCIIVLVFLGGTEVGGRVALDDVIRCPCKAFLVEAVLEYVSF